MNGLLLILAHPDDESFMAGGTIASLADRGVHVSLVCATRGDQGSVGDPPLASREDLPALRERELRDAADILGVASIEILDHRDRQVAEAPRDAMRAALVAAIRRERPRVVVTFDPHGVNGHPDHVAIGNFAIDAVTVAADPRWLPSLGDAHAVDRIVWPSPVMPWDECDPARLRARAGVDFIVDTTATVDRKAAALRAHRTQRASVESRWFASPNWRAILSAETFRLGWGRAPNAIPAPDLFD